MVVGGPLPTVHVNSKLHVLRNQQTPDIIYRIGNAPQSLMLRGPNLPDAEIELHPSPSHPPRLFPAADSLCVCRRYAFDTSGFSADRFTSFRFQRLTDVTNAVIVFGLETHTSAHMTFRSVQLCLFTHSICILQRWERFLKTFIFNRAKSARWEN